ncbi:MAG TPA: protein-methionine-sulfoxide reductase heme-binding subunit MsrQ [Gammaproteobacteria bacterium]|nr:protein-methionine-sulfoxide reductase heme-binding subunit MsrQ [Gammaproteobacteria bacterium]
MRVKDPIKIIKPVLFALMLVPLALLIQKGFTHGLGANPILKIEHELGDWALRYLLITLAFTPLRQLTGWQPMMRLRRMFGLYVFFYACLHFTTWLVFDNSLDIHDIARDIAKRPYVTVGFSAFVLLVPLALTSTNKMVKRLGGKRWKKLHSLVYPIGTLVILHFLWLVKADKRLPIIYGLILIFLLLLRVPGFFKRLPALASKRAAPQPARTAPQPT